MTEIATYDEQGSEEWRQQRVGKITASRIYDIVGKTQKGAYTAKRADYLHELVVERLTNTPQDNGFLSDAMLWGLEQEARAIEAYEWALDTKTDQCGFIAHPVIPMSGASPDRLVRDNGIVEVKCPMSKEHLRVIEEDAIKPEHMAQIDWQLATTGRDYCDFVSFDPRMPEYIQFYCQRVYKDDGRIKALEDEVMRFAAELDAKLKWIEERFGNG